jgi:hypothetical protein
MTERLQTHLPVELLLPASSACSVLLVHCATALGNSIIMRNILYDQLCTELSPVQTSDT